MADDEKKVRIKNKLPAPVQITAEQLLREASERLGGEQGKKRFYLDAGNLDDYRQRERHKFEETIRKARSHIPLYLRYARWEAEQGDMARARSVYERAITQDPRQHPLWLQYGESEMRQGNVQLARNVWDRACTVLPRHDQFWYKRVLMEEAAREWGLARAVFDRWMQWQPDQNAWRSYVKFECRRGDFGRARLVFERALLQFYGDYTFWLEYVRFEERDACDLDPEYPSVSLPDLRTLRARAIYERSLSALPQPDTPSYLIDFAKFEGRAGEVERARAIYKYALRLYADSDTLRHSYVAFEKQHGDPSQVQDIVLERRRKQYEQRVLEHPFDYDGWFGLLRMEEDLLRVAGAVDGGDGRVAVVGESQVHWERVRDTFERAIANVPPTKTDKRHWRRYIYLWLFYALFEEQMCEDTGRAVQVLETAIKLIPHPHFTFAKVWIALSDLHVRRGDLRQARLTLGQALGRRPKPRLFKHYIDMETRLCEFERVRTIYERWLDCEPKSAMVWCRFADLERALGEEERCRAIYELALGDGVDLPELVWKAYIDWEVEEGRVDLGRALYERLLLLTRHPKVFISYAVLESQHSIEAMRAVMKRAYKLVEEGDEGRLVLVGAWRELEGGVEGGDPAWVEREYYPSSGSEEHGYVWPDPDRQHTTQKLLGLAKRWKGASSGPGGE